jgi:hypothetical protein
VRFCPRPTVPVLLGVLALCTSISVCQASEIVDGNNPPTVRNNMHSCPPGSIVTGVNVAANQLLCLNTFVTLSGNLTTAERVDTGVQANNQWPPDAVTRAEYAYSGPTMHWCGPDQYVTGVHVLNNSFNCAQFPSGSNRNYTPHLGHVILDTGTVRNNMHACPLGAVLVGAHFSNGVFLCAELPFCLDNIQCPTTADTCEFLSTGCATSDCIHPTTGVCRRQGTMSFREDNGCLQDFVGSLTDRSGNVVRFPDNDSFDNDDARSLQLTNVKAGSIVRVYDNSDGSTADDWTQIFVKTTGSFCVGTFQLSSDNASMKIDYHPVDNLDGKVSRVDVRSALIDFGGRCVDVNTNDNSAQVFACHAGPNQSWIYTATNEIRGWNNLCLEASNSDIQGWPQLTAANRRAAVRVAACTGGVNQKWSITEAQRVRMFGDMCLDIQGGVSQNNALLQIVPCNGTSSQRWLDSF